MLKVFNVIGVIVLLLLLRKLIWCLRWLWCWKHDRETPPPIGWLPSRDGGRFDAHMREKLRLPPEKCPWCGKDMEQGFLMSGRGVFWYRGIPTGKARWLSPGGGNIMRVDTEGFLTTYHTAWYCPDCKKMTIDAADLQTEAERNQAAFPVGAEETASQSDEAKEGE